jgi:hypothetical protein
VSHNSLSDRRKALEDSFFQDKVAKKISRLREELAAKKNQADLGAASGIEDQQLLAALVKLEVGASDLSALALIPLVRVAWADGTMKSGERDAILQAAAAQGVDKDSHGHQLLDAWLNAPPKSELYDAWASYVEALLAGMDEAHADTLKESILGLAHDVASAAGGILGLGAVSKGEQDVLDAISAAFDK